MAQQSTTKPVFPLAEKPELGYNRSQVDEFLSLARQAYEATVADQHSLLGVSDIRRVAFDVRKNGYSARHVDAVLDRLENVFYEREKEARIAEIGERAWQREIRELVEEVRGRLERPAQKRFRTRGIFASGYRKAEVDAFLDQILAALNGTAKLDATTVRQSVFHSQINGYNEDQVDAFLDAVVDVMLAGF